MTHKTTSYASRVKPPLGALCAPRNHPGLEPSARRRLRSRMGLAGRAACPGELGCCMSAASLAVPPLADTEATEADTAVLAAPSVSAVLAIGAYTEIAVLATPSVS